MDDDKWFWQKIGQLTPPNQDKDTQTEDSFLSVYERLVEFEKPWYQRLWDKIKNFFGRLFGYCRAPYLSRGIIYTNAAKNT